MLFFLIILFAGVSEYRGYTLKAARSPCGVNRVEVCRLSSTASSASNPILAALWNALTPISAKQKSKDNEIRIQDLKSQIYSITSQCQPNGLPASSTQQDTIRSLVDEIERFNPTANPAYSPLMNGYWRMLYTDFTPAAASSGKLGPFVGDVYQDLDSTQSTIRNILKIRFPPIDGALIASQRVKDSYTWEIEFDRIENAIFGIPLPVKTFKTQEIRLWQIAFLDNELRILRARRPETDSTESFIFVLVREQ